MLSIPLSRTLVAVWIFPNFAPVMVPGRSEGLKKGAAANILTLKEAVPWHVIDMPWDYNLMLNEMTLTVLLAGRRQSTATDHSRQDTPAIKVNRYFNSSWNNPSTGLEACLELSSNGDTNR
jgi:hypothetical protein